MACCILCKITCFVGSDSDIGRRKKKIAVGSDDEGSQGKIDGKVFISLRHRYRVYLLGVGMSDIFFNFIYTMANSVILSYIWRQLQWQCTRTLLSKVNYLKGDMLK